VYAQHSVQPTSGILCDFEQFPTCGEPANNRMKPTAAHRALRGGHAELTQPRPIPWATYCSPIGSVSLPCGSEFESC